MKKLGIILAILAALTVVGCQTTGGAAKPAAAAAGGAPFSVDLSTVQVASWSYATKAVGTPVAGVRNVQPFERQYDGVLVVLPELSNVTAYQRVTIRGKYFKADGEEIEQSDGQAMVVIAYDITGDLEGPAQGAGPNTPYKEFNLGGFSSIVSTDKGARIRLGKAPGGILLQCSNAGVKFIEITEITFHD